MPISFPDSPSVNDTYTVNGRNFIWNGAKWKRLKPRVTSALPTIDVSNDFSAGDTLHVDSETGRVGIGTSSPAVDLHVDGDVEFTGTLDVSGLITSATASAITNDTTVATTAYVTTAVSNLIGGAPAALDTLNELAAALDDDASYAATITTALAGKLDSSSYTAADVLAKLITVDGAGSSLDADTLDGSHASAFAASSHTHSYAATSHTHSYLPLTGGTVTGQTTFSATDGVKITGSSGGIWFDDRNGDGSKYVLYHSGSFFGIWNGSTTPFQFHDNGVGYATNWSVGTGSSTNSFVGGSNYWRPQDAYGNSYFDINSGQFYVDSDTYYFRNRASTNNMTIDSSGNVYVRGTLETSGRIYPRNWIEFSEYEGLYSPLNAAHFYPNNGSYGSWRVAGTRGNWAGLEFDNPNGLGNCSLMMGAVGSNYFGVHRNNTGWLYYFNYQDLYCNSYRGFNNVAGTGNASYHPSGIYSTGTNWLYGTINMNGNTLNAGNINGSSIGGGNYSASGYYFTYGGNQQTLINGTNAQGSVYLGVGVGASATGGIEASWRGGGNPSIAMGVTRDSDNTKIVMQYDGKSYWHVDNVIRIICNTSGVQVQGSWTNYSSRALKENIRDSYLMDGATPLDIEETLDKWLLLQPRVFDWIEKPHDKWWVGCDDHDNRFECEEAGCPNDVVERIEHTCGKGWCYGTLDNPCPRYTGVRDRLHFIAEEVLEVLGDHVITLGEDRTVQGINVQAFTTEHVHATQQLIRYVRELETRIALLEATNG